MCREPIEIDRRTQCIGWLWWNESNAYFIWRVLMTILTILTFIYSWSWYAIPKVSTIYDSNCCAQYYFYYLTHWGLVTQLIYFLFMIYLHGQCLYNKSFNIDSKCNNICFNTMKAFYCIGLTATLILSLVYWPLFYPGKTDPDFLILQILQHTITPIIFFIEYFINLNQLKYKYTLWVFLFALAYSLMHIILWLVDGETENGDPYIYSAIDFTSDPVMASIILGVICASAPITYLILCAADIFIMRHLDDDKIDTRPVKDDDDDKDELESDVEQERSALIDV